MIIHYWTTSSYNTLILQYDTAGVKKYGFVSASAWLSQ